METQDAPDTSTLELKDASALRERMIEVGINGLELAREADDYPQNVSAVLLGHQYFGATRRARWGAAILRLSVKKAAKAAEQQQKAAETADTATDQPPRAEPRIRRL